LRNINTSLFSIANRLDFRPDRKIPESELVNAAERWVEDGFHLARTPLVGLYRPSGKKYPRRLLLSVIELTDSFATWSERGLAPAAIVCRRRSLEMFLKWLASRGGSPEMAGPSEIEDVRNCAVRMPRSIGVVRRSCNWTLRGSGCGGSGGGGASGMNTRLRESHGRFAGVAAVAKSGVVSVHRTRKVHKQGIGGRRQQILTGADVGTGEFDIWQVLKSIETSGDFVGVHFKQNNVIG
jgi:hypothetical protein